MDIKNMLENYKKDKATIEAREIDIEGLKKILELGIDTVTELENDCIQGMSMSAKIISDMPPAKTNKFHSSTEDVAMRYKTEKKWKPLTAEEIRQQIKDIESRIYPLKLNVKRVDVLIDSLTEKEAFIIRTHYIDGLTWNETADRYKLNYELRDTRTIKTLGKKSIEKMEEIYKAWN